MSTGSRPDAHLIRADDASSRAARSGAWRLGRTLPPDLLAEAVKRLRVIALLYAFTYLMADLLPALLIPEARAVHFARVRHWLPGVMSIAIALVVVAFVRWSRVRDAVKLRMGLVFQVVGSFGIALAEYHDVTGGMAYTDGPGGFGLSWVSAWVLVFTVSVPSPPRVALAAAVLSVSAVPLMFALGLALGSNTLAITPSQFFMALVFPYMLVVLMAYVGARVTYGLGAAVREARELGSYRLVERLGQGGMGEVWRAEHRMLARPAAIKLIRPEVLGATHADSRRVILGRFEREAQATALMRSPHTMELYDFGVTDDGTFYYVMELLDGLDLQELVETTGPVPVGRAVHLLVQLCDSLAEAHDAGLIHRDFKPANVYLCRQGRSVDFVKVLDFGLVKASAASRDERLTAEHATSGTPAFMSPEQALGTAELDGRSDLYAVGCVGFWLLTGSVVFPGRTAMEMMMRQIHDQPDPPSRRSELPIPPELDAVVLRCLAKDPAHRPQTADELRGQLEAVPLAAAWGPDQARRWWAMHRPEILAPAPLMLTPAR